jgi:hypothetical protein
MRGALLSLCVALGLPFWATSSAGDRPVLEEAPAGKAAPSPEAVLRSAFENQYDCDTTAKIELVMRNGRGSERRRLFDTVSKRIDGRLRSIGRLVEPAHLRGMTVMTIEVAGRREDTFVYLPSMRKVRRVTSAQRGDSFLGSDLTYEDFERRRVEDFLVDSMTSETLAGELVYRVRARPRRSQFYAHLDFWVARADRALLATRYFKRGAEKPFRTLEAPREQMVERGGHVLPTWLMVRNTLRGTSTEIRITDLEVNPEIDERLFSITTLEQQRALD